MIRKCSTSPYNNIRPHPPAFIHKTEIWWFQRTGSVPAYAGQSTPSTNTVSAVEGGVMTTHPPVHLLDDARQDTAFLICRESDDLIPRMTKKGSSQCF